MTLAFLNDSRAYESSHHAISFWGHDSSFEVHFRLEEAALAKMTGRERLDETEALAVFDMNKAAIRSLASRIYRQRRARYCPISQHDIQS
jgi:hypothetical protein